MTLAQKGHGVTEGRVKQGKNKCQAVRLADCEANKKFLHETAISCQVIIFVEKINPRRCADDLEFQ